MATVVCVTVFIVWLPVTFLCRKPSAPNELPLLVPVSGDRVDSTLEPVAAVDVAPAGSLLDFGAMVEPEAFVVAPELKSL